MASAPTGLSVTSTSSSGATVEWTNVGTYLFIELQYKHEYLGWTTESASIRRTTTSYEFTGMLPNVKYTFRVRGQDTTTEEWSDWSNTDFTTCAVDTVVKTLNFSGSITDIIGTTAVTETVTKTIEFSGYSREAGSISTTYAYYVADSVGNVYLYSGDYNSDGGTAIPCLWQSKQTNFVDQFKELENRYKNVHFVRLYYVDLDTTTPVSVKISNDGGATWAKSVTKNLGTGDGKDKSSDFFFNDGPVAGQFFTVVVETAATDKRFQLTGVGLLFDAGGEDFSIA